jgi:hypothetical protein
MEDIEAPADSLKNLVVQLVASNLAPLYVQIRGEGKSREEALVETLTAWSELCGMLERLPKGAPDI